MCYIKLKIKGALIMLPDYLKQGEKEDYFQLFLIQAEKTDLHQFFWLY